MATPTDRLIIIQSYIDIPPTEDFQWGYLTALMDEAAQDMEEAGSDVFNEAMQLFSGKDVFRTWTVQRTKTLG